MADGKSESGFEGWAILELMGHRRLGGRISEETIAGAAFVRIDIPDPENPDRVVATQFYSPSAVYAITPTTGEIAAEIARSAPEPVSRWELRALEAKPAAQAEVIGRILDELEDRDPAF